MVLNGYFILDLISAIKSRRSAAFSNSKLALAISIWADKSAIILGYSSLGIFLRFSLAVFASLLSAPSSALRLSAICF
jgi:hypothetical protein